MTTDKFSISRSENFALCYRRSVGRIYNHTGSNHTAKSIEKFRDAPPGFTEPTSRLFKTHPEKPCHTLRAGTDSKRGAYTAPRPIHYSLPRCLSVREGARVHSYPDWFRFHRTIWHGFRQIGNSVAPLMAKQLGSAILSAMGRDVLPPSKVIKGDESLLNLTMNAACDRFDVPRNILGKRDKKCN